MILGILYNANMDATEETPYFESASDVIDEYDFNDFLLAITACAIT